MRKLSLSRFGENTVHTKPRQMLQFCTCGRSLKTTKQKPKRRLTHGKLAPQRQRIALVRSWHVLTDAVTAMP